MITNAFKDVILLLIVEMYILIYQLYTRMLLSSTMYDTHTKTGPSKKICISAATVFVIKKSISMIWPMKCIYFMLYNTFECGPLVPLNVTSRLDIHRTLH